MTILAVGGGSGGHVTPALAVLTELNKHDRQLKIYFVTDRKFFSQAKNIISKTPGVRVRCRKIFAGKLRRYHNVSWFKQLLDIPTIGHNVIDLFLTAIGLVESLVILLAVRPNVVFAKGGYVCLPMGLAAKLLRIPLVIHDSDAHPGLTSRMLSRYAKVIATGSPTKNYPYPKEKTHYVGVPVDPTLVAVTAQERRELKLKFGFNNTSKPLLLVYGGGLGSRNINMAVVDVAAQMLEHVNILHVTGNLNFEEVVEKAPDSQDYVIKAFLPGMTAALQAADVVISRAGATAVAEQAALGKASIVIPSPYLAGGHQLKNAKILKRAEAAVVLQEEAIIMNPKRLQRVVETLAADPRLRKKIGDNLHKLSKPDAAVDMAALIVEVAVAAKTAKKTKP